METDTDPRMVDADQIPPSNDPNRRLNPPRIPFPLLMPPTLLAYMYPGSVEYAQYSSRPVTSYDDSDDDDWDEPVARLPGSGTTSPSHKDGGGDDEAGGEDDEAGGEDDEASGGGHDGDVSSVAGTPAPIGARVRSLERRVCSLCIRGAPCLIRQCLMDCASRSCHLLLHHQTVLACTGGVCCACLGGDECSMGGPLGCALSLWPALRRCSTSLFPQASVSRCCQVCPMCRSPCARPL